MVSGVAAAFLLTAGAVTAAPGYVPSVPVVPRQGASSIQWGDCQHEVGDPSIQCGVLTVPLDYTDEANTETIELELIKYPAATQPAPKGSILLNFGGPGQDGLVNFLSYLPVQGPIIGDQHDIISWDPRGTRNTLTFSCTEDINTALLATGWYNSTDVDAGGLWAEGGVISELCYQRLRDIGSHVGMAAVSRDIISIVDALGEDGLVRYWGISGGTALGSTLAAMFPERMDKIILDGVMNVHQWYHQAVEDEWFVSTDDTLRGIFKACVEAGESRCILAEQGKTAEDIEAAFDEAIETLRAKPIPIVSVLYGAGATIKFAEVMPWLLGDLYRPNGYVNISIAIDALIRRDGYAFVEAAYGTHPDDYILSTTAAGLAALTENGTMVPPPPAVYGIRCGDKVPRAANVEEIQEAIEVSKARTKWFYGFGVAPNAMLCAHWKFEAKERYLGDFKVKTKNPILFIGNSYDPVTPLASAKNMSASFEGSVVLEHGGFGHVSFVAEGESNCTIQAIQDYLNEGKLPEPDTKCESNKPLVDLW